MFHHALTVPADMLMATCLCRLVPMKDVQPADNSMTLLDHLEELRRRLLIVLLVLVLAVIAGWFCYPIVFPLLSAPVIDSVRALGGQVITLQPGDAFFTRTRVAIATGAMLVSPFIIWQLWAFLRPALTRRERKALAPLMPAICLLFVIGAGVAFLMLPAIMRFFLAFIPTGVVTTLDFQHAVNLPLKIMLAFGMAFQLPVLLLGLVLLRVISPGALLGQWRVALVILGVIAAVITPTGDPLNWALMMLPLSVLYFGTVLLAFRLTRHDPHHDGNEAVEGM